MKRIKLLSLFMAVIVMLFGSGCGAGPSEKELEEYKQMLPYQKLLADQYQPELPGYELEFRICYHGEDLIAEGYTFGYKISTFFITIEGQEYKVYFLVKNQYGITTFQIFESGSGILLKEFSIKTESVYASDFFCEFQVLAYQDGEFFALTQVTHLDDDGYWYYNVINTRPVAFYKVDFELEKVYYLGYAKGWYEFVVDNISDEFSARNYNYRVIKRTE